MMDIDPRTIRHIVFAGEMSIPMAALFATRGTPMGGDIFAEGVRDEGASVALLTRRPMVWGRLAREASPWRQEARPERQLCAWASCAMSDRADVLVVDGTVDSWHHADSPCDLGRLLERYGIVVEAIPEQTRPMPFCGPHILFRTASVGTPIQAVKTHAYVYDERGQVHGASSLTVRPHVLHDEIEEVFR